MFYYKSVVQYDGTRYNGWQRQGNSHNTIEEQIEKALFHALNEEIHVIGSGRTDAGVHAFGQVVNFSVQNQIQMQNVLEKINQCLPQDIAFLSLEPVSERFHSRLNAKSKKYVYRIWNYAIPNVFERKYMCHVKEPLDVEAMRQAAGYLIGRHDFKSFCSNKRMKKSTVRELYAVEIQTIGHEIRITFHGNGFLYHMVRILVGTLAEVGMGLRSPQDIPMILEAKDREKAGITFPPHGLMLARVYYE